MSTLSVSGSVDCVCIHMGNMTNGHYMAFVKKQKHWFFCNDEMVVSMDKTIISGGLEIGALLL